MTGLAGPVQWAQTGVELRTKGWGVFQDPVVSQVALSLSSDLPSGVLYQHCQWHGVCVSQDSLFDTQYTARKWSSFFPSSLYVHKYS